MSNDYENKNKQQFLHYKNILKNSKKIKEIFKKKSEEKNIELNKITQSKDNLYKNNNSNIIINNLEEILNFFNFKNFLFKATFTGIIMSGFGLIIEHPLDSIKVQWQAEIKYKNSKSIIRDIYNEKGILGFYRGFIPNLLRRSCKNIYRWPLMLYMPKFFNKLNSKIFSKNNSSYNSEGLNKIQTGLFLANFETLFISPIERLKVYFMTHKKRNSKFYSLFYVFYKENKGFMSKELFRGLEASLYRSNFSWVTFLYLEYEVKKILLNFRGKNEPSFYDLLFVSLIVMIGNLGSSKIKLLNFLNFIFSFFTLK